VLMFIGFAGDAYKRENEVTLEKGGTAKVGRYRVKYNGLFSASDARKEAVSAKVTVYLGDSDKVYVELEPAKWAFHGHSDEPPTTEVAIHRTLLEDLYVVLAGYDNKQGLANLKLVVNPLVNWIWLGFMMLAFGTAIAFLPDRDPES
jgi:cytochrome c-type biogenesis protein CcmF